MPQRLAASRQSDKSRLLPPTWPAGSLAKVGTPHKHTDIPIKNTAQHAEGKGEEAVGKVTGNDQLRAKGKANQRKADFKQAGEKVKDALKG
jgi:uncharacterized protein YjbJ (UPF0337 family)